MKLAIYRLDSLGDDLLPTAGFGVVYDIVESVYPKCIYTSSVTLIDECGSVDHHSEVVAGTPLKVGNIN